jgi:hypothetical protein
MSRQVIHTPASARDERETVRYLEALMSILQAIDTKTPPTDTYFEYLVPANSSIYSYEPHEEDVAFFVAEGEAVFTSGEAAFPAIPGTLLFLPHHVGFGCVMPPSRPMRILSWTTPLDLVHRATGLGTPGEAIVISPPPTFATDRVGQLAALLKAYLEKRKATASEELQLRDPSPHCHPGGETAFLTMHYATMLHLGMCVEDDQHGDGRRRVR